MLELSASEHNGQHYATYLTTIGTLSLSPTDIWVAYVGREQARKIDTWSILDSLLLELIRGALSRHPAVFFSWKICLIP